MSELHFTRFGQPILSPDQTEIWAYWSSNNSFHGNRFEFNTLSDLLDSEYHEGTPKGRTKYVHFNDANRYWIASDKCIQRDFVDCDNFIPANLTGPESVNNAITTLLADPDFFEFFGEFQGEGGESVAQKLNHYQQFNLKKASRPMSLAKLRKKRDCGIKSFNKRSSMSKFHKLKADDKPANSLFD